MSKFGASLTWSLENGTTTSSPEIDEPAIGTNDSLLPNRPVLTVSHSGLSVPSSTNTLPTEPILLAVARHDRAVEVVVH